MEDIKIILGDIVYPKTEVIIIPGNVVGLMNRGVAKYILKDGLGGIKKEVETIAKENILEVGKCFKTGPGRLNRRGIKQIYHAVLKHFPNEITSLDTLEKTLKYTLNKVLEDNWKSVAISGMGFEEGDLDKKSVANIFFSISEKLNSKIEIKIIDFDKEFIEELEKIEKRTKE